MISDHEIKEIRAIAENELTLEADRKFKAWKDAMEMSYAGLSDFPQNLKERINIFVEENRVAFFVGYKERLRERVKGIIKNAQTPKSIEHKNLQVKPDASFKEIKDRAYLEAYFINRCNQRRTAESLQIPKSTLNDWLENNMELVISEARKTGIDISKRFRSTRNREIIDDLAKEAVHV